MFSMSNHIQIIQKLNLPGTFSQSPPPPLVLGPLQSNILSQKLLYPQPGEEEGEGEEDFVVVVDDDK